MHKQNKLIKINCSKWKKIKILSILLWMILCILIKIQPGAAGGSCEMSCSCSNAGADGRVSSEIGAGDGSGIGSGEGTSS